MLPDMTRIMQADVIKSQLEQKAMEVASPMATGRCADSYWTNRR